MKTGTLYLFVTRICYIFLVLSLCVLPVSAMAASPLSLRQVQYWAYQIQNLDTANAVEKIAASRYDMVVIDPTVTTDDDFDAKDMVRQIKESKAFDGIHRKLVIAYLDIGEAEEWRWY